MTWYVLGESVTGTSHRDGNIACQDSFRFCLLGPTSEWLVVTVADGAGSASHSEVGASRACDEFIRLIKDIELDVLFTREGMIALFSDVRDAVIAEAERLVVSSRELACTALLAVIGPASAAVAQIGDGAIVFGDGQGYLTAFWPEPAEYANATDFLTEERFTEAMRFKVIADPISEVALLSDGLQRLALDFTALVPFAGFFRPLFRDVRAAVDPELLTESYRAFLNSSLVNARTDDDKTLVIAVRHP